MRSSILAMIPCFRQRIIPEPRVPSQGSQARGTRLGQTRKDCFLAMLHESGQNRTHCFLAMFPKGRQTRKHPCLQICFLDFSACLLTLRKNINRDVYIFPASCHDNIMPLAIIETCRGNCRAHIA